MSGFDVILLVLLLLVLLVLGVLLNWFVWKKLFRERSKKRKGNGLDDNFNM